MKECVQMPADAYPVRNRLHHTWFSLNSFVAFTLFGAANLAPEEQIYIVSHAQQRYISQAAEPYAPFFVTALPLPCLFAALFFFKSPFLTFRCCCGIANDGGTARLVDGCRHGAWQSACCSCARLYSGQEHAAAFSQISEEEPPGSYHHFRRTRALGVKMRHET